MSAVLKRRPACLIQKLRGSTTTQRTKPNPQRIAGRRYLASSHAALEQLL